MRKLAVICGTPLEALPSSRLAVSCGTPLGMLYCTRVALVCGTPPGTSSWSRLAVAGIWPGRQVREGLQQEEEEEEEEDPSPEKDPRRDRGRWSRGAEKDTPGAPAPLPWAPLTALPPRVLPELRPGSPPRVVPFALARGAPRKVLRG